MSVETQGAPTRRSFDLNTFLTNRRVEIFTAILLSLASLLAAWCAYQASAWNSEQASQGQAVARKRLEATRQQTRGGQLLIIDVTSYTQWLQAQRAGDAALAQFIRNGFRKEFKPAFEAWLKLDPENNPDAGTPFERPEYSLTEYRIADAAETAANAAAEAFQRANDVSTAYVRETLFTAMTLFLGAMAGRFSYRGVRLALLALATAVFVAGLVTALALPVA